MAKRKDEKSDIKIRLNESLRLKIERSARAAGVSMNSEMITKLGEAYAQEAAFAGPDLKGVAIFMAAAFAHGVRMSGKPDTDWKHDRDGYTAGALAVMQALWAGLPDATDEDKKNFIERAKGRLVTEIANRKSERSAS